MSRERSQKTSRSIFFTRSQLLKVWSGNAAVGSVFNIQFGSRADSSALSILLPLSSLRVSTT